MVCFIQCFCERQGGPPSCRRRQVSGVRGQSAHWRRVIVGSSQHDLSSTVQKKMLADVVTSRRHQTRGETTRATVLPKKGPTVMVT